MYKEYILNDNCKIEYSNISGTLMLKEMRLINNIYEDYIFIYSSDFGFNAYSDIGEKNELVFSYDKSHPFYYPLLEFLKDDKKIRINDDFRKDEYNDLCYIDFYIDNEKIYIKFVNYIDKEHKNVDKFSYGIKNIMYDLRSKLDTNNTNIKERLCILFRAEYESLINNSIEINNNEYKLVFTK